jgi:hypothetical protein
MENAAAAVEEDNCKSLPSGRLFFCIKKSRTADDRAAQSGWDIGKLPIS